MPSLTSPVTSALCESRLVGTSHELRVTSFKSSRFTLLSKNALANHLESHSCKNKGLKVPCFHTLTKKGVGEGGTSFQHPTSNLQLPFVHIGRCGTAANRANYQSADRAEAALRC